jgi:DNA polymerase III alpha subunit
VCFSKAYMAHETVIKSDDPVLIRGTVRLEGDGEDKTPKFRVSGVSSLADERRQHTRLLRLNLGADSTLGDKVERVRRVLGRHPGMCRTVLELKVEEDALAIVRCGNDWSIDPCDELLARLERVVGKGCAQFG